MKTKLKPFIFLSGIVTCFMLMILVFRNTAKSNVDSMAVLEFQESEEIESQQQNAISSVEPKSKEDDTDSKQTVSSEKETSSSYYDLPDSYYEKQALVDSVIGLYVNGEWDGYPTIIEGHTFSLSRNGELLMDDFLTSPSKFHSQHCLDLPADMHRSDCFILGDGSYLILNNRMVKYLKGKEIPLSGGSLVWNGIDLKHYRPYDTFLYYDEFHDTLFLVASSVPYDYSNENLKYNIGIYLYMIPDRTKSEIVFVSEITNLAMNENGLFYADTSGYIWRYTEKNGKNEFLKSFDPNWKNQFSRLGIASGEIEFDWWCTFADGYIHKRKAFPEGTFDHPVVTTPMVDLSSYTLDCRYKNMYSY